MASDRSWMHREIVDHVVSVEFMAGVETFIQFALGNPNAAVDSKDCVRGQQTVRESRRLPICLLVPGRTIAEQGLRHHQQCNFLSLYTSGYAPGSVVLVYGFSCGTGYVNLM
ncbi:hypothetical protein Taro_043442 [Colocasia esculenta]|uniref:Uncharacterized protein n=1 Tax=Colocasia esculenta TaxID=4460 RepID=A0A843X449_COLES|nr:hypothetical protein [Colocasia esculenta]